MGNLSTAHTNVPSHVCFVRHLSHATDNYSTSTCRSACRLHLPHSSPVGTRSAWCKPKTKAASPCPETPCLLIGTCLYKNGTFGVYIGVWTDGVWALNLLKMLGGVLEIELAPIVKKMCAMLCRLMFTDSWKDVKQIVTVAEKYQLLLPVFLSRDPARQRTLGEKDTSPRFRLNPPNTDLVPTPVQQ